jgi:NAD(P)-dependent dehydrogenase (short-subunit alcohol dehydrogenase family)
VSRLDGKIALITGSGSGIGRGIVERFLAEGARVGAFDVSSERLNGLKDAFGESVVAIQGDASVYDDNVRAVDRTVETFGRIDVFVANAGVYDNGVMLRDVPADNLGRIFDEIFGINVKGYLFGVKAALEELERSRGNVILTASISSLVAGFGGIFYVPVKHAVLGMTKQLAYELAPTIRVNAVALGYVATELSGAKTLGQRGRALADPESAAARIPLGIAPGPQDITGIYALLASDSDGRFVTGSTVLVDGGQILWGPPGYSGEQKL